MTQVMKKSFEEAFKKGTNPLIKLICFDMGGVYFDGDFKKDFLDVINDNLSQNIQSHHDQKLILDEDLNLGKMKITEWVEEKIGGRQLNVGEKNMVNDVWRSVWKPNPDMRQLVEMLKRNNYCVGVFSNMDEQNGELYRERGDFNVFPIEYIFLSYEVGYTKPHKEFFENMLKRTGLKAYQILLIDDHEKNITKSKELGFQTLQYHNDVEQLKIELQKMGIGIY